jgi:hypothetical protein
MCYVASLLWIHTIKKREITHHKMQVFHDLIALTSNSTPHIAAFTYLSLCDNAHLKNGHKWNLHFTRTKATLSTKCSLPLPHLLPYDVILAQIKTS